MRAISAPRWQRVSTSSFGARAGGLHRADQRARARGEAGTHAGVAEHEAQRLRQAAVDLLDVAFEGDVVGEIELADTRRVAAAAEVLQQQRIVELPDLGFAETDLAADVDADPAAAHAMAGRLAFHQIQRIAERA